MREINIERCSERDKAPHFMLYDATTGDPLFFLKSFEIYADVDGYTCKVTRFIKNEEGLYGEDTEVEEVRIRELRMRRPIITGNYYDDEDKVNS